MTFLAFTGLINFLTSSALAVLVFRKCPRRDVGVAYAVMNMAIASYSAFYFLWQCASTAEQALFNLRMLAMSAMWINQGLLYLNGAFFGWTPLRRKVSWFAALANVFFSVLNFTGTMYSSVVPRFDLGFWPATVSGWFIAYLVFWHAELLYAFGDLIATRQTLEGHKKDQVTYLIAAFAIGYIGGITNWPMWFGIHVAPYPNILISIYTMIVAYAMIRHHLMDISIVIKKTLLYSVVSTGLASLYAGLVTLLARLVENHPETPAIRAAEIFRWCGDSLKIAFPYSCLGTTIFSIGLGLFVWMQGRRKSLNILWGLTCIAIGAWSLGIGMMVCSPTFIQAYHWQLLLYTGSALIPIVFFHFVTIISESRADRILKAGYFIAALLIALNFMGRLASVHVQLPFTFYTTPLRPYALFVLNFFIFVVYAHVLLVRRMFKVSGLQKNQIKFILLGTGIGFCGGATTFFLVFNIPIFPFGVYAVPIYIVTVSYAIYRHQLMDINVVIRKTLLYSLVSAVLASVYVGTITLLAQVLGARHGSASVFSSALGAIFITLMFNPLRIKTQHWIDQHFPREHLDPDLLQEAAGGFAHEMKRPLSKISLPTQLLLMELKLVEKGEKPWMEFLPELKKRLQFIVDQSMEAGFAIEAIRELSSTATPFESVDLGITIDKAMTTNKDLLENYEITIEIHMPADLPPVSGRPRQLEIVFVNLIKNAVEAMRDLPEGQKRELRIKGLLDRDHVNIQLVDTGVGIKAEDSEKLFSARYSTKGQGGTGLGLYLSRQIIEVHHGTIEVSKWNGNGTTFTIRLPIGH